MDMMFAPFGDGHVVFHGLKLGYKDLRGARADQLPVSQRRKRAVGEGRYKDTPPQGLRGGSTFSASSIQLSCRNMFGAGGKSTVAHG